MGVTPLSHNASIALARKENVGQIEICTSIAFTNGGGGYVLKDHVNLFCSKASEDVKAPNRAKHQFGNWEIPMRKRRQ